MQTLKEYREMKGVKLCAVAEHLGISRQTYRECEKRQGSMSVDRARAVCDFLGCSFDQIFLPTKDNKTNIIEELEEP